MKLLIDTKSQLLLQQTEEGEERQLPLYSPEAFALLSEQWLKIGWNERYHYTFSWMGRPILQLPEDLLRLQEVIVACAPDVIVETGVALGGSVLFYATLCRALGKGRVIGVDINFREPNRRAVGEHPLAERITIIDGSSTDPAVIAKVRSQIGPEESALIILDSNHSKAHVRAELEGYHSLVSKDSYLVVCDGYKKELATVPRGKAHWSWDNPSDAVTEFLSAHPEFVLDPPKRLYNRSPSCENVTHLKNAWLRHL